MFRAIQTVRESAIEWFAFRWYLKYAPPSAIIIKKSNIFIYIHFDIFIYIHFDVIPFSILMAFRFVFRKKCWSRYIRKCFRVYRNTTLLTILWFHFLIETLKNFLRYKKFAFYVNYFNIMLSFSISILSC